jgi:uncharacterized protein YndB with AHSA1/START domain
VPPVGGDATVTAMADRVVSVSRVIHAPPAEIFDVLADPTRHGEIDGSGMVERARGDGQPLRLGSKFGMDMRFGPVPYRMSNEVVEFEKGRRIAWQHVGRHRWRYELVPVETDDGPATEVTESFDWSTSRVPWVIELAGYPSRHPANMAATLERLAAVVE